jgi:hypothetical protein
MRQILAASGMGVYALLFIAVMLPGGHAKFAVTHGNFFIFKTSGGAERFTTEGHRHGVNFRCYTESNASGAI